MLAIWDFKVLDIELTNPVISPDQNFEKTLATQGLGGKDCTGN